MASSVLQFLRAADWLDAQRVRGYALLLGIASCALLAVSSERAMGPQGSDFLAFWGAGKVAFAGDPELACDLATQRRVQTATGSANWLAFVNPPPFLLLAALLGALPYPLAWLAWTGLTLAAWALAAIGAFPRLWPLVAVFPGALLAAGHAQTGLLTGALLIGGVSLLDRRRLLAGILFGALVIKPHLALLVPIWLAAGRRWPLWPPARSGSGPCRSGHSGSKCSAPIRRHGRPAPRCCVPPAPISTCGWPGFHAQFALAMPVGPALLAHAAPALGAAAPRPICSITIYPSSPCRCCGWSGRGWRTGSGRSRSWRWLPCSSPLTRAGRRLFRLASTSCRWRVRPCWPWYGRAGSLR